MIKPAGGYSSQGVIRVDVENQLGLRVQEVAAIIGRDLNRMAQTRDKDFSGILVEEYITGEELTVGVSTPVAASAEDASH